MPDDALLTQSNFEQASLLVIEDQADVWLMTQFMLNKGLPEVQANRVATGPQALTYLTDCLNRGEDLPKLILQDLYLPDRHDGLRLIGSIRDQLTTHAAPQLPIVVFSSSNALDDVQQCYRAGASAYIVKTIDMMRQIADFNALRQFWWETNVLPINQKGATYPPIFII
jgi:CheY-like chemotaxis protein